MKFPQKPNVATTHRAAAAAGVAAAAAIVGIGGLSGTIAIGAGHHYTISDALRPSQNGTTIVTTPPSAPEIPSASPTVKAPPYGDVG